ncbi:MAG: ferrous iron transport protein B [Rhodospirillaceae bacterium]
MTSCKRPVTAMLVGNPNCGKTVLFNCLTGDHGTVANYSRVTVTPRTYPLKHSGAALHIVDLPGIYTLNGCLPEERAGRDALHFGHPEVVINVLDAGNLHRSLFLTIQLVETGRPCVFVLNMIDEARSHGIEINTAALSAALGGPVIETVAVDGVGVPALSTAITELSHRSESWRAPIILYDDDLEAAIARIQAIIAELHPATLDAGQSRWLAIKLLEGDSEFLERESEHRALIDEVRTACHALEVHHGEDCASMIAHARFRFIKALVGDVQSVTSTPTARSRLTRRLDDLLLHRFLGLPILAGLMWLMFQATFTLGALPMAWIDTAMHWLTDQVAALIPPSLIHDLVVNGIMAGVGGTIVFLPNIVILFFFMSILSETGYLARAAFLLDRLMNSFGLHGKALIPLIMGFGCNATAVMATRTIESQRSRLIAILAAPYVSCSARLPVFILFAGAFFGDWAGTVVFALYATSVAVALGSAILFDRLVVAGKDEPFLMELPPYRRPSPGSICHHVWDSAEDFLRKVGGVIIVGSIAIWFLQQYPTMPATTPVAQRLEQSYLGQIAATVTPVFAPLGFGWKDSIAILTGLLSKEVVVSSYAVLNATDKDSGNLREALSGGMTPPVAISFMVFVLLYAPCLSTVAVIRREAGGWRWAGVSFGVSLVIAWSLAFITAMVGGFLV